MFRWLRILAVALLMPGAAWSASVTFTGSGSFGSIPLAASVVFSWNTGSDTLTVTLRNIAGPNAGSDVPASTLTGVFWNLVPNITLVPQSANVASGSSMIQTAGCALCVGTNVGGEFGYQAASLRAGADRAIASSGYMNTGAPNNVGNFNTNGTAGTNLEGPASLDGINFGIVTAGDSTFTPNGGIESVPLIRDAVVFTLTGTGVGSLVASDFNNVSFQYGTALSEPNLTACVPGTPNCTPVVRVPEPGTIVLMSAALLGVMGLRRRRH